MPRAGLTYAALAIVSPPGGEKDFFCFLTPCETGSTVISDQRSCKFLVDAR